MANVNETAHADVENPSTPSPRKDTEAQRLNNLAIEAAGQSFGALEDPHSLLACLGRNDGREVTVNVSFTGAIALGPCTLPSNLTIGAIKLLFEQRRPKQILLGDRLLLDDEELQSLPDDGRAFTVVYQQVDAGFDETLAASLRDRYALVETLGRESNVYKARILETGGHVAVKRIKFDTIPDVADLVHKSAVQEASILSSLRHPNVVRLAEVISSGSCVCLVMDCMELDLYGYLKKRGRIKDPVKLKAASTQCLSALHACHSNKVLHRDFSTFSLLIDEETMNIKLSCFGSACFESSSCQYDGDQTTHIWYRAHENLLDRGAVTCAADMWSAGCVLGELATGAPLFRGDSEIGTIFKIYQQLGTPCEETLPGVTSMFGFSPAFPSWKDSDFRKVKERAPQLDESGLDLLRRCLTYNPENRISVVESLEHDYLRSSD